MTAASRTTSPIMIIGTERSGSNLLRLVLSAHPNVAVPHPPHFMRYFGPIIDSYGDLTDPYNRRVLVRDLLTLLRTHIHPWEYPIDEDVVMAEANPTLFGVVSAIYEQYRRGAGKPRWGCKSTFMVDHVDDVLAEYPKAQFVWLVRDPRDVAASARRSVFGPCHPYLTAVLWRRQQERGLAALNRYGPEVVHLLRYEEFVSRPEEEIAGLCDFAGEPFEPRMLQHHRSDAARRTAALSESWSNADRPIAPRSVGRYVHALSDAQRRQVEWVAGPMMRRLGYDVEPDPSTTRPLTAALTARDIALRAAVEFRSLCNDSNHSRRWRRDATVQWLRLKARARTVGGLR